MVIVHSLLVNGVVRNISTVKVAVEEFAHRLQALHPVISDLFLEDSAHDVSSEIRRYRGTFPNECGHEAKSLCKQLIGPNTTWGLMLCVQYLVLVETARVRSKYEDGRLGWIQNLKYVNDQQST